MFSPQEKLGQILRERPPVHPGPDGNERCIGLHSDSLSYLFDQLSAGYHTIETGCGLSTLIFALAKCNHQAIVPNRQHIEETCKYANKYDIPLTPTAFIQERSEIILPTLQFDTLLDVVLIDGGHAFPIPYIDWFYTSQQLAINGLMVIDDLNLKTVRILYDFLDQEPEWIQEKKIHGTAFFRKIKSTQVTDPWDYWRKQPFNNNLTAKTLQLSLAIRNKLWRRK